MGYFFLLGSLRAFLMITGLEVAISNYLIIFLALVLGVFFLLRKKTKNEN